jgi:hypothetical protein
MTVETMRREAAALIHLELMEELISGNVTITPAIAQTITLEAEALADAGIEWLDDLLARNLHDTAARVDRWAEGLGVSVDAWSLAEEAASGALGNY